MEVKLNTVGIQIPYVSIHVDKITETTKPFILNLGNEDYIGQVNKSQIIYSTTSKEEYVKLLSWFHEQKIYIQDLSYIDKLYLLSYTFHGDKIANAWARGKFNIKKMRELFDDDNDEDDFMPLAPAFYELIRKTSDINKIVKFSLNTPNAKYSPAWYDRFRKDDEIGNTISAIESDNLNQFYTQDELEDEVMTDLNMIKTEPFNISSYMSICRLEAFYTDDFIIDAVSYYTNKLNDLIINSPPLTQDIHAFRGIKSAFVPRKEGEKVSVDFISTSLSFQKAREFMDNQLCCMKHLLIKKGTKCMYLGEFSFVVNESEILLPPMTTFKTNNIVPMTRDYIYYKPKKTKQGGFDLIEVKNKIDVIYCEISN
jgi:hypothetical protein